MGVGKVTHGRGSGLTVTGPERPDGIGGSADVHVATQMSWLTNRVISLLRTLQQMLSECECCRITQDGAFICLFFYC